MRKITIIIFFIPENQVSFIHVSIVELLNNISIVVLNNKLTSRSKEIIYRFTEIYYHIDLQLYPVVVWPTEYQERKVKRIAHCATRLMVTKTRLRAVYKPAWYLSAASHSVSPPVIPHRHTAPVHSIAAFISTPWGWLSCRWWLRVSCA